MTELYDAMKEQYDTILSLQTNSEHLFNYIMTRFRELEQENASLKQANEVLEAVNMDLTAENQSLKEDLDNAQRELFAMQEDPADYYPGASHWPTKADYQHLEPDEYPF